MRTARAQPRCRCGVLGTLPDMCKTTRNRLLSSKHQSVNHHVTCANATVYLKRHRLPMLPPIPGSLVNTITTQESLCDSGSSNNHFTPILLPTGMTHGLLVFIESINVVYLEGETTACPRSCFPGHAAYGDAAPVEVI